MDQHTFVTERCICTSFLLARSEGPPVLYKGDDGGGAVGDDGRGDDQKQLNRTNCSTSENMYDFYSIQPIIASLLDS